MKRGNLIVLSGPSGVGKGTLVARLLQHMPDNVWVSVSATTRQPRVGEEDGVHYFFIDQDRFDEIAAQDGFIEWANVHGNCYGTPRAKVEEHIAQGFQVILEIDVQGALQVREKMPEAKLVFVLPPDLEQLEMRLRGRGTDSEEVIDRRLRNAHMELSLEKEYDFSIVNDDAERATNELIAYINALSAEVE